MKRHLAALRDRWNAPGDEWAPITPEEAKTLTPIDVEERSRRRFRATIRTFGALWLLTVAAIALLVFGKVQPTIDRQGSQETQIEHAQVLASTALAKSEVRHAALRSYQIASCKRANESRAGENRSHRDDYLFDTALARGLSLILGQASRPNPLLTAAQNAADRDFFVGLTGSLGGFASDKEWRPLIVNCVFAVDHPGKYVLPPSVKFSERPAPTSALYVEHRKYPFE